MSVSEIAGCRSDILAPDGLNESTARTFRRDFVSKADEGVYTADVFNTAGSRTTRAVRLNVLEIATEASLSDGARNQVISASATNNEDAPVDVVFSTEWGTKRFRGVEPGRTVSATFQADRNDIVLGDVDVQVTAREHGRRMTADWSAHYGEPLFGGQLPGQPG